MKLLSKQEQPLKVKRIPPFNTIVVLLTKSLLFFVILKPINIVNSTIIETTTNNSTIPPKIQKSFINWKEPFSNDLTEIPLFWHIPKVAGTTIQYIFSNCLHLIAASEVGIREGHDNDTTIKIVNLNSHITKAVNVDTTSTQGLQRAQRLGLIQSGLADVIYTHLLNPSTMLFDDTPSYKGRLFAIFRDPIDRALSMYYYLQKATWEITYDKSLQQLSLEEYAKSDKAEHNWMVRMLVDKLIEQVDEDDLQIAKDILHSKCVIGLHSNLSDSIARFEMYFHWRYASQEQKSCQEKLLQHGINMNQHPAIDPTSEAYKILYQNNLLDIQLYEYAVQLFKEQGYWFDLKAGVTC